MFAELDPETQLVDELVRTGRVEIRWGGSNVKYVELRDRLTGRQVSGRSYVSWNIALGQAAAGLMSNDDSLAADLGECGRRTHERLWRLPLWDDYRELIKGSDADINNAAGKQEAHAIVGGMFLKEFVNDDVPWAHLDIASVAISESDNVGVGKGATGFGVRLLIEYLRRRIP